MIHSQSEKTFGLDFFYIYEEIFIFNQKLIQCYEIICLRECRRAESIRKKVLCVTMSNNYEFREEKGGKREKSSKTL